MKIAKVYKVNKIVCLTFVNLTILEYFITYPSKFLVLLTASYAVTAWEVTN